MKSLIYTILLVTLSVASYGQKTGQTAMRTYRMEFVFTGEIRNAADSAFALRYTFSQEDMKSCRALLLETDGTRRRVDMTEKAVRKGVEIKYSPGEVHLMIRDYDKYDLPVPVEAEDDRGAVIPLFLLTRRGGHMSAGELKSQIRGIRETAKASGKTSDR